MKTKIKLIGPLGFCYGVKRAVNLAERVLENNRGRKVYSLGGIIHNRDAVMKLSQKGLIVKNKLNGIKKGDILIISSHGIGPQVLNKARKKGIKIIDATCPNVITSQRLCGKLNKEGYFIVIVGDRRHKEIEALQGFAGQNNIVIKNEQETRHKNISGKKIGVIVQTTQSKDNFVKVLSELIGRNYIELRIFNTICNDTLKRQKAALDLAKRVDAIFVIGGKHSANTNRLFELCRSVRQRCFHIENEKNLKIGALKKTKTIGVVSGASTPDWIIKNVLKKMDSHIQRRNSKQNCFTLPNGRVKQMLI